MKTIAPGRIAELGYNLSTKMEQEYGGLTGPQTGRLETGRLSREAFLRTLKRGRWPGMSEETALIKPHEPYNLARLTSPDAIGRTFGIMTKKQIVHAGIITDRTKPGELHFTRLVEGGGVELGHFSGIDDLGRISTEVGGLIQHPKAGTEEADASRGTAGEIGHAMQALSALTDPSVLDSLLNGKKLGKEHLVHGWAEDVLNDEGQVIARAPGIAASITDRGIGISALTVKTDNGDVPNGFAPELIITEHTPDFFLVDHVDMTDQLESSRLGVSSEMLAAGMGMLAAESQLGTSGALFDEQVMKVMAAV